jgi:predicted DsbA family dithiol-disulfide isomerase
VARVAQVVNVEIFSDVVCPWCYLTRARFRTAVEAFEADPVVTWRAFQLDPGTRGGGLTDEYLAERFGGPAKVAEMHERMRGLMEAENLPYEPERAIIANTRDAHRVIALAGEAGEAGVQDAVVGRLFRAHHAEGRDLNDHGTLAELAGEAGLDGVTEMLAAGGGEAAVTEQVERARAMGVNGVPFVVFEDTWAVSGAQPAEVFESALREVAAQA